MIRLDDGALVHLCLAAGFVPREKRGQRLPRYRGAARRLRQPHGQLRAVRKGMS
jgi:hypothetical protein